MTPDSILLPPVDRTATTTALPGNVGKKPGAGVKDHDELEDSGRRRRLIIRLSIGSIVVAVVFSVVWVGARGVLVANAAVKGAGSASSLATLLGNGELAAAELEAANLQQLAAEASSLTSDPVWRMVELVPVLGGNLTTVRESAAALASVTDDALEPLIQLMGTMDPAQLTSANRVDRLLGLAAIAPLLEEINTSMASASERLGAVDASANVGILADGFGQLNGSIQYYAAASGGLHRLMPLLPSLTAAEESSWLVQVTDGTAVGKLESVAHFTVSAGADGLRIHETVTASSGTPVPVVDAAQAISIDVATLQLMIEHTGAVNVPDVGEVTTERLTEITKALSGTDAAVVTEAELSIAATARSIIERLLG